MRVIQEPIMVTVHSIVLNLSSVFLYCLNTNYSECFPFILDHYFLLYFKTNLLMFMYLYFHCLYGHLQWLKVKCSTMPEPSHWTHDVVATLIQRRNSVVCQWDGLYINVNITESKLFFNLVLLFIFIQLQLIENFKLILIHFHISFLN